MWLLHIGLGSRLTIIYLLKPIPVYSPLVGVLTVPRTIYKMVGENTTGVRKIKKEVILSLFLLNQGHHHTSVRSLLISIFPGCRQTVVS